MSETPKVDTDELRALVTTLEKLITEASRVTGELKAAIASAEAISAPGPAVVSSSTVTASPEHGVPVEDRLGSGGLPQDSSAVRAPASTPWARKRAATSAVVRPSVSGTVAAAALPAARAETTTRTEMPAAVLSTATAVAARPASPPPLIVAEPAGPQQTSHPVDRSPGPAQAAAGGPAHETQRAPALSVTGSTSPTVSGGQELDSVPPARRDAPADTCAAAADHSVIAAAASTGERVPREPPDPPEPAACSSSGSVRGPVAPLAEPALSTGSAEASRPADRARVAGGPPEQPRMAAHSEMTRPPAPEPRPAPRTIELPPDLSLQLARITRPVGAGPVLRRAEPMRTDLPAEPETAPALHVVDESSTCDTLSPPPAESDPLAPSEALAVVPGTGGDPADAIRSAKDMARRHGLKIRGFETAGLETEVVQQIAAALNDLLAKYTVALYGIEVTEQRDNTIRRERKKAAESGSAEPPPVWITLERAVLSGPGATGPGSTRRRFRRAGSTGRPVYAAVVRAFAAALDEAGDYRARQEAWRILMAGSLSGGPDIGAGLLDPGQALVQGFAEVELHGKRAGEPAKALHRALLKMAQADSEESTA